MVKTLFVLSVSVSFQHITPVSALKESPTFRDSHIPEKWKHICYIICYQNLLFLQDKIFFEVFRGNVMCIAICLYTLFFYKNIFYKNIEAEVLRNFKNILRIKPRLRF